MSAKVHLLSCSEPHQDGSTVRVACGIELPNATHVAMVDREVLLDSPQIYLTDGCPGCIKAGAAGESVEIGQLKRYCYGLVSGEESKQMERK